jgi:hypothetical protein
VKLSIEVTDDGRAVAALNRAVSPGITSPAESSPPQDAGHAPVPAGAEFTRPATGLGAPDRHNGGSPPQALVDMMREAEAGRSAGAEAADAGSALLN